MEKRSKDKKKKKWRKRWSWFRERRRAVKQRMEDLASWVALVGKASPLLPDKRWPWPMMWNGFDWLRLIPQPSAPRSSPGVRERHRNTVGYFILHSYNHDDRRVLRLRPRLHAPQHLTLQPETTIKDSGLNSFGAKMVL